jgi:hypothetical protein
VGGWRPPPPVGGSLPRRVARFFHAARELTGGCRRFASARVVTARIRLVALAAVASAGLGRPCRPDGRHRRGACRRSDGDVAVIYLTIGIIVGALVAPRSTDRCIIFIWMFDVFLGPAMGRTEAVITHFALPHPGHARCDHHPRRSARRPRYLLAWSVGVWPLCRRSLVTTRPIRIGQARPFVGG